MKKLSIFLCIVMILTMLPTMGVFADYQSAADTISFVTFRGTNTDQFGIKENLVFPEKITEDEKEFDVEWTSSNPGVISIAEEASDGNYIGTVTRGVADEWVTVTAKVYHETASNTFVTRNYLVRVSAAEANVRYLLQENFDDKEVSGNASDITSTTASSSDWYFNGSAATENRTDYKFVTDEILGGKALKMTSKSSVANYFAVHKLTDSLPESGLVSYSVNIKMASANPTVIIRPFSRQMSISSITSFATSNAFNTDFPSSVGRYNNWINLTTVYDVETKIAKVYANGIFMFEEDTTSAGSYLVWDEIRLRMVNGADQIVYVDNIEVKEILSGASEKIEAFNPATKGSSYVDGNLATSVEGIAVSYESSDESVIAKDGSVTRSEFYRTVTVTPIAKAGNFELRGNTYTLTVLPETKYYKERLFEDFEDASEGKIFGEDGTTTYNGWSLDASRIGQTSYSSYKDAIDGGVKTEIENVDGDNALLMEVPANKKGYRIQKTVETLGESDRVVLSMRVKNGKADTFALASSYIGMFNDYYDWRGDWGGNKVVDDIANDAFKKKNVWQTYLFVFDRGITENSAHPISLYIDGKYIGTQWEKAASIGSYLSVIQFYQNNTNGYASSIYVDDILLAKIDVPELQLAGATVEEGVLKSINLQYISYGTQKNMTVLLAEYEGDKLTDVKIAWETEAGLETGYYTINTDCALSEGATSYRLFLLDSVGNLKPLAISKQFAVK